MSFELSRKDRVEYKCRNPIFSEIIIKLNTRKVMLSEFYKEFKTEDGQPKARATLVKQITEMLQEQNKDQYFMRRSHTEGKKQYYELDGQGLLNDYFRYLKELNPRVKFRAEHKKANENIILKEFFQDILAHYHKQKIYDRTLEDIYRGLSTEETFTLFFNTDYYMTSGIYFQSIEKTLDTEQKEVKVFLSFLNTLQNIRIMSKKEGLAILEASYNVAKKHHKYSTTNVHYLVKKRAELLRNWRRRKND